MTNQNTEAEIDIEYFGGCRICGKNDGYLNLGREHWFVCHTHRMRWCWGSNLVSSWRFENESDWKKNWERIGGYQKCKPWFPSTRSEK